MIVIDTLILAALVIGNDIVAMAVAVDTRRPACVPTFLTNQGSIEFLALAHRLRAQLPKGHAELADQLRRSAQSVPLNIAEGCGRTTRADKAKHYTIARGSAMESAAHLDAMRVDGLVDVAMYERGMELLERIVAMLTKMIDS